jgi:hypothetical protein
MQQYTQNLLNFRHHQFDRINFLFGVPYLRSLADDWVICIISCVYSCLDAGNINQSKLMQRLIKPIMLSYMNWYCMNSRLRRSGRALPPPLAPSLPHGGLVASLMNWQQKTPSILFWHCCMRTTKNASL